MSLKISVYSKENTAQKKKTISKPILTYSGNKKLFWIIQSLTGGSYCPKLVIEVAVVS